MAKKNAANSKTGTKPLELNEKSIGQLEKDTLQKVNKTISVLESAIAAWDSASEKPKGLEQRFAGFRKFRDALAAWEAQALKAAGKKETFEDRVKRLREFTEICFVYGKGE